MRKHVDYDSFGKVGTQTSYSGGGPSATDQRFYFTGQEWDVNAGMYNYDARWYSPTLGRFVSEDPSGLDASDANLYRYVGNSPTTRTDPTGLVQAGNPLNSLFGKPTVPVPSGLTGLVNSGFQFTTPSHPSNTGLDFGTTVGLFGSSIYNAATSQVAQIPRTAINAAVTAATIGPILGQQSGPAADDGYVRQIVPGVPIVPRQPEQLPIRVQQAIREPDRYIVRSHQDQGYLILDRSGAVKFVNDPEVLPLTTLQRQAQSEGKAAAGTAGALTLVRDALISISPIHETARDAGIAAFGYDYAERNRPIDVGERATAGFLLFVPGGNSSQVRKGDDLLDVLDEFRRYGIRDRGPRLGQQQGREFHSEQLQLLEFDPDTPAHVRGFLKNERRRIEQGLPGPATPPGYELSHGRTTPAREGYDYSNARLQGIDLNRLEERIRLQQGRP